MKWPNSFEIGPYTWPVEITKEKLVADGKEVGGYADFEKKKIRINPGFPLEFRLIEEVAHCISDVLDIDDTSDERHHALRQYSMQVLAFLKYNADFVRDLLDEIESPGGESS
jgi:hypothetical protein